MIGDNDVILISDDDYGTKSPLKRKLSASNLTDSIKINSIDNFDSLQNKNQDKPTYYQKTFRSLTNTVLHAYGNIFREDELELLRLISSSLSNESEKLFIRLILRKPSWIRVDKLSYDEIKFVEKAIEELCGFSLIESNRNFVQVQLISILLR